MLIYFYSSDTRPEELLANNTGVAATFLRDGAALMEPYSLLLWFARAMLQYVFFFAMLLPASIKVQVDADKFLEAFSMQSADGTRVSLSSWKHAPGQSSSSSSPSSAASSSESSSSSACVLWQNRIDAYDAWLKETEEWKRWIPNLFAEWVEKEVVVEMEEDGEEEVVEDEDEDEDDDEENESQGSKSYLLN